MKQFLVKKRKKTGGETDTQLKMSCGFCCPHGCKRKRSFRNKQINCPGAGSALEQKRN